MQFTACYRKLEHGYMGKLLEWPGVVTSGDNIDDCKDMLIDAACEMALAYQEDGRDIPNVSIHVESVSIPLDDEEAFREKHKGLHDIYSDGNGKYVTLKQAEEFDSDIANELCKEAGIPQIF